MKDMVNNKVYKIYVLKDILDNIKYVGITCNALSTRLNKHYNDIKGGHTKNTHKINWFNKNLNSIFIECIEETPCQQIGFEREIYWIAKYRSMGIDLINKTDGGEGCCGYKHTEETLEKMKGENNHNFGRRHTPEWIAEAKKRIPVNKGIKTNKPAHNRGVSPSAETLQKMREVRFGAKHTTETIALMKKNHKNYLKNKKIEGFINGVWIVFESATEASIELKLNRTKITSVCLGNRKSTGGIFFRYFGSDIDIQQKEKSGRRGKLISVIDGSEETIYSSITEASNILNIPRKTISKIISGEIINKYIDYKIKVI